MKEFSVKRMADDGKSLFRSLATLLEDVSCCFVLQISYPAQKQCYVVLSQLLRPLKFNGR
jgi:hypothetical protein